MQQLGIIGTGISGMGAAYYLKDYFDITLIEREDYVGGHTHTLTIDEDGQRLNIDSAFMVYNERTYPLLTKLFFDLGVVTRGTDMSFSVQQVASMLEYCGTGFNGLFVQRRNLCKPWFWRMLLDIDRFRREAVEVLDDPQFNDVSLGDYVTYREYSTDFIQKFLLPMSSAVWSTPFDQMLAFPAKVLVRFFENHCFLGLNNHLQWRTCVGGSRQYRDKLLQRVNAQVLTHDGAIRVGVDKDRVIVRTAHQKQYEFDKVIIAAHAPEALMMLQHPNQQQRELLGKFLYHVNKVVLHTDTGVMPQARRAWSAWNYRIEANGQCSTIYWMNRLQHLSAKQDYFISINDPGRINPKKILKTMMYTHPVFNVATQQAQPYLHSLNVDGPIYFCGAYFRYGFHEDGLLSAHELAKHITAGRL